MDDRDKLAKFLQHIPGHPPLGEAETRDAADRITFVNQSTDAELYANGYRFLTVVHGDIESADDERCQRQLSEYAYAQRERAVISTRASNDTTTWIIRSDVADVIVEELADLAQRLDPGWWRIRRAGW